MSYTVTEKKTFTKTHAQVYQAAQKAIAGLEGKILVEDATAGTLKGQFDKKIHGQVLGDRTQVLVTVSTAGEDETVVTVELYPINPVGQKLMFGARQGVPQKVTAWYWAHLEHHLG